MMCASTAIGRQQEQCTSLREVLFKAFRLGIALVVAIGSLTSRRRFDVGGVYVPMLAKVDRNCCEWAREVRARAGLLSEKSCWSVCDRSRKASNVSS